ncbi:hypothetical protein [Muricoccus pecuniae]|uniref:Uncharacterized protein n=1 Tax=Muricoccus pecuniae TaxID=693023 RepID=A0A840YLN5_9PROT|nr:hypothetical protein [Roseomonas pecuniae]MBB5696062.1 hypothetical protein [Roseomonas pecuniae]
MAGAKAEIASIRLPHDVCVAYGAPANEEAGESVQRDRSISEADLRQRVAEGGRIQRVVVVEVPVTADYVAWARLSCFQDYRLLAMRKYEGARTWSDFRTLRRAFSGWGYAGPVTVYPEGHPRLACLGLTTRD